MKQGVIICAIACTALFASCTKDSSLSPVAGSTMETTVSNNRGPINATAAPNPNPLPSENIYATVNYQFSTTQSAPSPVQWTSGAMSLTTLGFDGYQNADDIMRSHFETSINRETEIIGQASLGTVTVLAKKYDAADLVLTVSPTSKGAALSLSGSTGSISSSVSNVPIQVIINKPVSIVGKWRNALSMNNGQVYNARLVLDLSALTNGITATMLQSLPRTNGVIIISSSSNLDFYNMIIANLQNALQVQLG
jgi:hypothetical protein